MFRKKKKESQGSRRVDLNGYYARLGRNDPSITTIDLAQKNITDADVKWYASLIVDNTHVKNLFLGDDGITSESAKVLAFVLERNSGLKTLILYGEIGDAGATELAGALLSNKTLTRLDLGNDIGNAGANDLAGALLFNHTLVSLYLDDNPGITDGRIKQRIKYLLYLNNTLDKEEAARRKEVEFGAMRVDPAVRESSPFFVKLIEPDARNVNFKLTDLIPLIKDVHQLKIFYTFVASCLRSGAMSKAEASSYIKQGFEKSWAMCSSENAIVTFKLILEKASEDGHIPRADFHLYDNRAEVTRMEHTPFIKSMREAIRANTVRIEGLEANVEAVNNSINSIKKGLRRKQKVEATVGFIGAVVNAVTLGVGGSLLAAAEKTLGSIVDFGDIVHMQKVVADVGDHELMEHFELGVEIASGRIADDELEKAIKDDNVLVVLSAAAVMVQQVKPFGYPQQTRVIIPGLGGRSGTIVGPVGENGQQKVLIDGMTTGVSMAVADLVVIGGEGGLGEDSKSAGKDDALRGVPDMFCDAILKDEEEEGLPVHAAIKYGDKECLEEALAEEAINVNEVDSKGRTAMDLAALTGQLELLQIVKDSGGKFKLNSTPKMKLIAKKRDAHSKKYLEYIQNK